MAKNEVKFKETEIGSIPEEWAVASLGDFFPIKTGKRDANFSVVNGKYPFFTCAQNALRCDEYSFDGNALLLSGNGDFNMKKYSGKFDAYQRTYVLMPHEKDERDFLYYAMKYHLPRITEGSRGSVISFLTKGMIEDFKFGCPTKAERQNIAEILSSLDEKIELNRKMNKTLEEIAQALFKRWFVDFEFPDENGKPYKSNGGKMIDSDLGLIPEGWRAGGMIEEGISNFIKPGIDNFSDFKEYVETANVDLSEYIGECKQIIFENRPGRANMQPIQNSVCFARMAKSRKYLLFQDIEYDSDLETKILSTGFAGIECAHEYLYFYWCFISSDNFDELKDLYADGAVQIAISNSGIKKILLALPPKNIADKFSEIVKELFLAVRSNELQNRRLVAIRDSLLSRLMSGKIRV